MSSLRPPILLLTATCVLISGSLRAASDYSVPYVFSTAAGDSSIGSDDGPGKIARFYNPRGIAIDRHGNLYVADTVNNTIRKITPDGVVSTLAGTARIFGVGYSPTDRPPFDGTGPNAIFSNPEGIAVDASGTIYVTDKMAFQIRRVTPEGVVTTVAGAISQIGPVDGTGADARFGAASGAAVDAAGNLYVSEWTSHVIRKVTPAGVVTTIAGQAGQSGKTDGPAADARFSGPNGLAVGADGSIYVADTYNSTIRRISPAGVVSTVAGQPGIPGNIDGPAAEARFRMPYGLALDRAGNLYVADTSNAAIRKITPAGAVTTFAGNLSGATVNAIFRRPVALVVDAADFIYVVDESDNTIVKISPAGVVTIVAGIGLDSSFGNNDGTNGRFNYLGSTAVGPAGELYVADPLNATIRKVTPEGVVSTLAGKARALGHVDGTGADARFQQPYAVAVDGSGNVYVADPGDDTIRKITPAGVVSTLAGDPAAGTGFADGTGSQARFAFPFGIAVNPAGTVYVADSDNYAIRSISPGGVVTTLAGKPGSAGTTDGSGSEARFREPAGLSLDAAGNLLVADAKAQTIRRVSPAGAVSTVAGKPDSAGDSDGDLATARFQAPSAVTSDTAGNLYVADSGNHLIRRVGADGKVTTLGGLVRADGYANGIGVKSRFMSPPGIAAAAGGKLYVTSGSTLRLGQLAGPAVITGQPQSATRERGTSVEFAVVATGAPDPTYQWQRNGTAVSGATSAKYSIASVQEADAGDYTVVVSNSLGNATSTKATLTVTTPAAPPPPPPSSPATGGGGGGGAPSAWFLLSLGALTACRALRICIRRGD